MITRYFNQYNVLFAGWAIGNDERNWKYRLSIYYVKQFDTGTYTCTTSRDINNTVTLRVSGKQKHKQQIKLVFS